MFEAKKEKKTIYYLYNVSVTSIGDSSSLENITTITGSVVLCCFKRTSVPEAFFLRYCFLFHAKITQWKISTCHIGVLASLFISIARIHTYVCPIKMCVLRIKCPTVVGGFSDWRRYHPKKFF